jgi:hypothetical protein
MKTDKPRKKLSLSEASLDFEGLYQISNCPAQDKNYGNTNFYQGDGFSCRYSMANKAFFKSIYIPYGPNFNDIEGFKNFINWIDGFKFSKVKIDLYRIYADKAKVMNLIEKAGFKPASYTQDSQTSIVKPADFNPNSRAKRYIKSALKHHTAVTIQKPGEDKTGNQIIDQCYEIYRESCKLKGYELKRSHQYFYELSKSGILTVVKDNQTDAIDCFLLSDIRSVGEAKDGQRVMYLIFTAMTSKGRDLHLGFLATANQFEQAFDNNLADQADFMGFSSEKGKHSIFKTKFGNQIIDLAGSFERIKLL